MPGPAARHAKPHIKRYSSTERPNLASGQDPRLGSVAVATRWARDALSISMSMARLSFLRLLAKAYLVSAVNTVTLEPGPDRLGGVRIWRRLLPPPLPW